MSKTITCIVNEGYGVRAKGLHYAGNDKVELSEKDATRLSEKGIVTIVNAKQPAAESSVADILDGNTESVKAALGGLSNQDLNTLLNLETGGKTRKGVVDALKAEITKRSDRKA